MKEPLHGNKTEGVYGERAKSAMLATILPERNRKRHAVITQYIGSCSSETLAIFFSRHRLLDFRWAGVATVGPTDFAPLMPNSSFSSPQTIEPGGSVVEHYLR